MEPWTQNDPMLHKTLMFMLEYWWTQLCKTLMLVFKSQVMMNPILCKTLTNRIVVITKVARRDVSRVFPCVLTFFWSKKCLDLPFPCAFSILHDVSKCFPSVGWHILTSSLTLFNVKIFPMSLTFSQHISEHPLGAPYHLPWHYFSDDL